MFSATKGGSPSGYQISRSVRLRSSASAYFNRTPASASNRKTWTWSGWVKRGALGSLQTIFSANNSTSLCVAISFLATDNLRFYVSSSTADQFFDTAAVFRDPSAWYHLVFALDTTQATIANRTKIFVNGVAMSGTTTGDVVQNADSFVNATNIHEIGKFTAGTNYFDGYLTEINFIDGQALTPSSFGQTNYITGVWSPIKYTGTYGTNGFYLNFSDNSAATAATIGKDNSGNGNNWTPNNISVTAGTTFDSMLDVPTQWADGGNGRGNYATLNPLDVTATTKPTNGNLTYSPSSTSPQVAISTIDIPSTGKWYAEFTKSDSASINWPVGIIGTGRTDTYIGGTNSIGYWAAGQIYKDTSLVQSSLATLASGDVAGVAVDADAKTVQFYKNGSSVGTAVSYTYTQVWFACGNFVSGLVFNANFGQRPFAYTPPTGFRALNTLNLPTPTILKGNQYMDATLYTGNGTSISSTQTISSLSFQPDLVWIKDRTNGINNSWSHYLVDAVRGINSNGSAYLASNETSAETGANSGFGITALNSNGFSLKANGTLTNTNGDAYIAWTWKEGATQGFDIVTYTGNGANRTIAHNLGVAPKLVIVKRRNGAVSWAVWQTALAGTEYLLLDQTQAKATAADVWNSTIPTSTVFSVGTNQATNLNTATYVAYLFSEVAGFSRIGSYTGNGSTDGPFVFCGFRPRWILIKMSSSTGDWRIFDSARSTFNVTNTVLFPNLSDAEASSSLVDFDITSNGFKLRNNLSTMNASGGTYIFAAFAENPFKNALAR